MMTSHSSTVLAGLLLVLALASLNAMAWVSGVRAVAGLTGAGLSDGIQLTVAVISGMAVPTAVALVGRATPRA